MLVLLLELVLIRVLCVLDLRVATQRVCNAPAFLLDGCYAFMAIIIVFVGLFYQGTLTEHPSRNLLTNSGVKLVKMDGLTEPLLYTFKPFYSTGVESWSSFFLHTISRAAAIGQDNEFLLISILLSYLFACFVNHFSYYTFYKNEIVVPIFSVCFIHMQKKIRSDYKILQKNV